MKLPAFRPTNIAAWFTFVSITSQGIHYLNVLAASTGDHGGVDRRPQRITSCPPIDGLKSRLFTAHQLTDIEQVEKLQAMLPRGQQKPWELLAEILLVEGRRKPNGLFLQ